MLITQEILEQILFEKKYDSYFKTRNHFSDEILLHARGNYELISELLAVKFPSEPEHIKNYRLKNFARITKTYFSKILTTLAKIDRAEDFRILYKDKKVKAFCENGIENYGSVRKWFFSIGLKALLTEPNGLIVCMPPDPLTPNIPEIRIIPAYQVCYHTEEYVLIELEAGEYYLYLDSNEIAIIEKVESRGREKNFNVETVLVHNLNMKPYFCLGGFPAGVNEDYLYESFVSGVVPFWNQALIEFSDKQAGIKQHLYPEKWRFKTGACPSCAGNGYKMFMDKNGRNDRMTCDDCGGTGDPPTGMFSEILMESGSMLDGKVPVPPVGYVQKDFDAIEYLDKDYRQNIYAGLAAINMEFLMESPVDQSGVAKEMDRQELNSFIYQIANHVSNVILKPLHKIIVSWLYYGEIWNPDFSLPDITTPVQFDYTGAYNYETKYINAKQAGLSSYIVSQLERKYIEKNFENFNDEKSFLLLVNQLDPVPTKNAEEKTKLFESKVITYQDFVCSVNIEKILKQILWDKVWFTGMPLDKQMKILYEYTDKLILQISGPSGLLTTDQEAEAMLNELRKLFDTMFGKTDQEKFRLFRVKGVSYKEFLLSINIDKILTQIIAADPLFISYPFEQQKAIIDQAVQDLINQISQTDGADKNTQFGVNDGLIPSGSSGEESADDAGV